MVDDNEHADTARRGARPAGGDPADEHVAVDVDIARDEHVTVTFADGAVCRFPIDTLRANCPCASCRSLRERGEPAWPRPGRSTSLSVIHAALVGAWGLSLTWNDGHDTGIYAWQSLRRWFDAGIGTPLTDDGQTRSG